MYASNFAFRYGNKNIMGVASDVGFKAHDTNAITIKNTSKARK